MLNIFSFGALGKLFGNASWDIFFLAPRLQSYLTIQIHQCLCIEDHWGL